MFVKDMERKPPSVLGGEETAWEGALYCRRGPGRAAAPASPGEVRR